MSCNLPFLEASVRIAITRAKFVCGLFFHRMFFVFLYEDRVISAVGILSGGSCVVLVLRVCHFAFSEAAALRSIVLRYACAPTATHNYLTAVCVLLRFCFFLFLASLEISLFTSIFVPLPFFLCMESTSYVFSSRRVFKVKSERI